VRAHVAGFAAEAATALPFGSPIVEIGARPANGQEGLDDPRRLFPGVDYIGCDIQAGPRVDRVEDVHHLSFGDESVGGFLALDTLEHVADPRKAVEEMWRVLRPGGVMLMSSVMFFPIHAHPWDYWRFTPEGFNLLLQPFESRLVMAYGWEFMPETVFGVGIKGPAPNLTEDLFPETSRRCREWGNGLPVDFGPIRLGVRQLWSTTLRTTATELLRRAPGREKQ
jgi:SAM-dependent methyltransferase